MVGKGTDPASVSKKCMWKEKIELHWRIHGHKERAEFCKQVSWARTIQEKLGK
jgi:hypothetical protein